MKGPSSSSNGKLPWLQLIGPDGAKPQADADGLIYVTGRKFQPVQAKRKRKDQLLGLSVAASALAKAIPYALEQGFDLLVLDGSGGIEKPWTELSDEPDLTVLRDTIRLLRKINREEDIALLYFGGLRSGTDVAKALAINCNAGIFGVAMGIAIGGVIEGDQITFDSSRTLEERRGAVESWIRATAQETAIIARCTGKTNVHNLEPEDMRSIAGLLFHNEDGVLERTPARPPRRTVAVVSMPDWTLMESGMESRLEVVLGPLPI